MKILNNIVFGISLVVMTMSFSLQTENCKCTRHKNITDKNNRRQGVWKVCYPNNKIKAQATYTNDSLNGLYNSYFENGNKKEVSYYKKGFRDSLSQFFYDTGKLKQMIVIENRRKKYSEIYYEDGSVKQKLFYNDSIMYKEFLYSANGTVDTGFVSGKKKPTAIENYKYELE